MRSALDDNCAAAVRRAVLLAELAVRGDLDAIDAAKTIAGLGSVECYEFLQEGFDMVDRMGAFWALVYEWESSQYGDRNKDEVLRAVRQEMSEFLMRARAHDA